jgi:predicted phosphodiesterase
MKLTTERLKKLIREELSKVTNESYEDFRRMRDMMGDPKAMAQARDVNSKIKIISGDFDGQPWQIEVDTRQEYGAKALRGDYMHPRTQELIQQSLEMGGDVASAVPKY